MRCSVAARDGNQKAPGGGAGKGLGGRGQQEGWEPTAVPCGQAPYQALSSLPLLVSAATPGWVIAPFCQFKAQSDLPRAIPRYSK